MKIQVYAKCYIILTADSIEEGVKLGILQEQLRATNRNIRVTGDYIEIPLANPDINPIIEIPKTKKQKK